MLWYKSWLDTRWRFLIGLGLLMCSAAVLVSSYPQVLQLLPIAPVDASGALGRQIREAVELAREYRGYIWSEWFRQAPIELGTLFATLLGTGGLAAAPSGGAALFTLSLPASRNRLIGVRAAAGLAQWSALAFVPSLVIPLLSPAIGQSYPFGSVFAHGVCVFVGGSLFFSLALFLSTVFSDMWRPWLVALTVAVAIGVVELFSPDLAAFGVFSMMNGETYFRTGQLPWLRLLAVAAASAGLIYAAALHFARRDF
jgi:ABC-type transport system involved in multi-copper enzyme maturation permease subunit